MKNCNICNQEKSLDLFVKRKNRKSGVQSYCKECHNKKQRGRNTKDYMRNFDLKKYYGIDFKGVAKACPSFEAKQEYKSL